MLKTSFCFSRPLPPTFCQWQLRLSELWQTVASTQRGLKNTERKPLGHLFQYSTVFSSTDIKENISAYQTVQGFKKNLKNTVNIPWVGSRTLLAESI
jgi:hypothetical protein